MVARLVGWESRLTAVIEDARARPYSIGQWDCFRLACRVVEALTGVDRWPEFAGSYSTKGEALRRIAAHGSSFQEAAGWFFGGPAIAVAMARRGDIAAYRDPGKEFHLAVIHGARMVLMAPDGLIELPRSMAASAWRVGDA